MNPESLLSSLVFVGTSAEVMNPLLFVRSEVLVGKSLLFANSFCIVYYLVSFTLQHVICSLCPSTVTTCPYWSEYPREENVS